jgi:hypothetical protein
MDLILQPVCFAELLIHIFAFSFWLIAVGATLSYVGLMIVYFVVLYPCSTCGMKQQWERTVSWNWVCIQYAMWAFLLAASATYQEFKATSGGTGDDDSSDVFADLDSATWFDDTTRPFRRVTRAAAWFGPHPFPSVGCLHIITSQMSGIICYHASI